jgi:hypothetical protein
MVFSKTYYIVSCIVGFLGLIGVLIAIVFYIYPVYIKELILKFFFNMDDKSIESFYGSCKELAVLKQELRHSIMIIRKLESDLAITRARLRISKKNS